MHREVFKHCFHRWGSTLLEGQEEIILKVAFGSQFVLRKCRYLVPIRCTLGTLMWYCFWFNNKYSRFYKWRIQLMNLLFLLRLFSLWLEQFHINALDKVADHPYFPTTRSSHVYFIPSESLFWGVSLSIYLGKRTNYNILPLLYAEASMWEEQLSEDGA